jgi:hypothetical protein
MIFILSLFISLAIGFACTILIFRKSSEIPPRLLLNISIPLSIGISSALFVLLNLSGIETRLLVGVELIALIFLIKKTRESFKLISFESILPGTLLKQNFVYLVLFILYVYSWLMDAGIFYFDSIREPHGQWDAWSYWNMKSRFLFGAPSEWPSIISQMDSVSFHIDYPLMQSAFIAKCWILLQKESTWIPIASAFAFTFCTFGLLSSSVATFTNKIKGLKAGLILLATPFFVFLGDSQYADVTVGFFMLATLVFITFADKQNEGKKSFLLAAGITASMAAWSKNEGILFVVCLLASRIIVGIKQPKELLQQLKYLLAGMLPVLILLAYYKFMIAPPNDLMQAAQDESIPAKLTDPERYKLIINWFIERAGTFGEWIVNPWWIFLIAALVFGVNNRNKISYILILFLLMLAGYFYSYVVSYIDLTFHLSTSLHRLYFQLFPSFLFCYFLSLKEMKGS